MKKCKLNNKRKILIVFNDMTADMLSNKKTLSNSQLNISIAFITQFYFSEPKNIRLNSTQYFFMKSRNKQELQRIIFNHSSDLDINLYEKCTEKTYFFSY